MSKIHAECYDGQCRLYNYSVDQSPYDRVPISEIPKVAIELFRQGEPSIPQNIRAFTNGCKRRRNRIDSHPIGNETLDEFVSSTLYFVDGFDKCRSVLWDDVSNKRFEMKVSWSWRGEVEYYKKKVGQDPENPWLHRDLAKIMFEDGKYRETIEYVKKAFKLDPHYCEDFFYAGISKYQLSEYEEAIKDLDEAIGLYPEYGAAYFVRGTAKQDLNRHEEAMADYDKSIELNPDYYPAYINRGTIKRMLGRYEEAIADYSKAIELEPRDSDIYYRRGLTERDHGQYSKAIESFERAIELGFEYEEHARYEIAEAKAKLDGGCGCSTVGSSSIDTAADSSLLSMLMTILFD